jgi:carbon monoxide dehydrogenase subunit G
MAVVTGERTFTAPPDRVFAALIDPEVVVSAIPSVRDHKVVDDSHWEARVKLPIPLAPKLTVRFEVLERRPSEHASLRAHGGGADVASTFELAPDGSGTAMTWRAEIHLTGALDKIIGGGVDSVARRQAERTLDAVERSLA